ncbi:MAG: hypothetical protein ACI8RZ_000582 [Myxococcota bacterium]|jgi:hypothetical protein
MSDLRTLADRVQSIHDRYRREFAGRSRISRDLTLLDQLIASLDGARTEVEALADAGELGPLITTRLTLYRDERAAIHKAQTGGPDEVLAHRIADWSWLNHRRYVRHFAGKSRPTRDLGLLKEVAEEQRRYRDELAKLMARQAPGWRGELLAQIETNLNMYTAELTAIPGARSELGANRRVGVQATAANTQFGLWRSHFAEKSRRTRRAALLRRMVGQLEVIHVNMEHARDQGIRTDSHISNISKVKSRLELYRRELTLIEQAAASAGPDEIARALGSEANDQFAAYRTEFAGKSRTQVDQEKLSAICDQLQEIVRNMDTLDRTWARPVNAKNLGVVLENLKQYEREHHLISQARQG